MEIATDVRENVKGLTVPKPNAHNRNYKAGNVRFGSKADICGATAHVRFVPIADIPRRRRDVLFTQFLTSARAMPPFFLWPSIEDEHRGAFGLARRVAIAFASRNDRAFHQHMPRLCELFRIAQSCILGQAAHDSAYLSEVIGCCATYRTALFRFKQHVDERAAFKRLFAEPAVEHIKNGQQPIRASALCP